MRKFLYLTAILALPLAFAACSDDDDDNPAAPAPETAKVMAIHASPDAPGVDLYVDDQKVATNLTFPNNSAYLTVEAGTRNVKVKATGTTVTPIDADLDVMANTTYSVFAIDELASIEPLVLIDDLTAPAAGKAHLRFLHLSPDAPAVDIALDGGAVVIPNVAFKGYTAFLPLDAGTYDLEVRVAGSSTVALDLDPVTLTAGKIYTVFAKGFLAGTGDQALGAQIIVNK
jgi:hypothetical protein